MKKIVIADSVSQKKLIEYVGEKLKKIGLKVKIINFENFLENFEDCDVILSNYSLCDKKELNFLIRCTPDAVFILDGDCKKELISIWAGTPHLRIIKKDDGGDAITKLFNAVKQIAVGDNLEIERKFLIEYPDIDFFNSADFCRAIPITQIYLQRGKNGENRRVRKMGDKNSALYVKTEKIKLSDMVRIENEYYITEKQFENELKSADESLNPISKTRYYIMYNDTYFELDVFPFWKKQAYLEVELSSEEEKVEIPPFIKVIREVTNDRKYTNYSLASDIPEE